LIATEKERKHGQGSFKIRRQQERELRLEEQQQLVEEQLQQERFEQEEVAAA
jgi:hypothetical protein